MYDGQKLKLSHREAEAETRRQLQNVGIPKPKIDAVVEHLEKARKEIAKSFAGDIATREDLIESGWYTPNPDGNHWKVLRCRMSESGLAEAADTIDRESTSIVAACAEPFRREDKRKGLVIGNVQSGKTANYAAVIAKAVDAGYGLVIVLAGLHNNLRAQTQMRLDRDLGVEDYPQLWYRLTAPDADMGNAEVRNAESIASRAQSQPSYGGPSSSGAQTVLAVVKKNKSRLENLLRFLQAISEDVRESKLPVLIIDDESDQATPDSSSVGAKETTAINRLVRQIWSEVRNGTYIGYTATPFANVFMSSEDELGDGYGVDLYPDDFIFTTKTPDTYFGAERLFGASADDPSEWADGRPDVIRFIPDEDRELLVPTSTTGDLEPPQMTESLRDAIKWFIVATAIRRTRGQQDKHSTMLVHTTHRIEPHFQTQTVIDAMLKPLKTKALDGDVSAFRDVFMTEVNRAGRLYRGHAPAPTWKAVEAEIPSVLRMLRTVVDNSKARQEDRLDYTTSAQTVIVIGGGTLSRGLTLEGLFVSYFTRTSRTYDTLLQMGRWFGYRHGYEDLQRIWLSDGLEEDYRHLALVEEEMRGEVRRLIANGDKPKDITVRIRQHPGRLQITNSNKMKNVQEVETDFEGYRMQTYLFDLENPDILDANLNLTRRLLCQIARHACSHVSGENARLFTDIQLPVIENFVTRFTASQMNDDLRKSAMKWARAKLANSAWNVVLVGGNGPENTLEETGFPVKTVTRAPIKGLDHRFPHRINFRTLMTGNDFAIDLAMQGYRPNGGKSAAIGELKRARQSAEWGNGRGLLALYPISRNSKPQGVSTTRQSMTKAFEKIERPHLAMPDDETKPIMACAVIMPWDVNHQIANKGTFVGVPRGNELFDEPDKYNEPLPEDREKDYSS